MPNSGEPETYFDTRLKFDKKRLTLWNTLWDSHFSKQYRASDIIVELGAGWCDFINTVKAERKIAVDIWPGVKDYADQGVEAYVGSAMDLNFLDDKSVNGVFASNLVEHLTRDEFEALLNESGRVLATNGTLTLLQPNYRLCSKRYFDDFTHISIWSDVSLADYLTSQGWNVISVKPRFMPLTVKSKFPVLPIFIKMYLWSPIKPLAGQMLLVATPPISN